MNVTVLNEMDSAYESQLFVEHQPSVTYIKAEATAPVICNSFNETVVSCTLGNPLRRNASAQVMLRFNPSGLEDSAPRLSFTLFANSTSKQIIPREKTTLNVNVVKKAELTIRGWALPEQSFYGGEIKGESGMDYLDDIGSPVQHTYQIYNHGPWRVPYLNVRISWPHQVANDKEKGKWLLYLEDKPVIEGAGGGECLIKPASLINPLNLPKQQKFVEIMAPADLMDYRSRSMSGNKSQSVVVQNSEKVTFSSSKSTGSPLNRVKRDHAVIIRAEQLVDKDGKKSDVVNMVSKDINSNLSTVSLTEIFLTFQDCEKNSAKCVILDCVIYNIPSQFEAYVHVKARLWNSTLVADYPRVDFVKIVSYAHISIPDIYNIQQRKKDDWAAVIFKQCDI